MEDIKLLNNVYQRLCETKIDIQKKLKSQNISYSSGYYSNHSIKDEKGRWITEYFPIPVITVESLCDIGIDINSIFVETKMEREKAMKFNFSSFIPFKFEVYGVDEYLNDFYNDTMAINEIGYKIENSKETQIAISFVFQNDYITDDIIELVHKLKKINTFI